MRALQTCLYVALCCFATLLAQATTACPEGWINTGRGWGASRKIKRQLFWGKKKVKTSKWRNVIKIIYNTAASVCQL